MQNQPNQRLVLLETNYGHGILFDQKDTVLVYQILSRATAVKTEDGQIIPRNKDIEVKLIAPSRLLTAKELDPAPETALPVAPEEEPIPF
jgi:hypothetical protein